MGVRLVVVVEFWQYCHAFGRIHSFAGRKLIFSLILAVSPWQSLRALMQSAVTRLFAKSTPHASATAGKRKNFLVASKVASAVLEKNLQNGKMCLK
ncbi:hypothetical protein [Pseudoduganella ginsengisoli]|uniref:Uncharacterized protein n=1 Tax=Pseudoduganella ginsengisoli TaxID=1462440 RepID=A0A6L6Q779_9BURK|nr:hypothetical protein [Pseudoduganella ginsengisoli]MTW04992.1 hypothetical protein [Pseudoduganella ginsengisoli]